MVGWHHRLNAHEFQALEGGDGQGSLVCCSPWGHKESDITERLTDRGPSTFLLKLVFIFFMSFYIISSYN